MAPTRTQQRYDPRLRHLVQHPGDFRLASVDLSEARAGVATSAAGVHARRPVVCPRTSPQRLTQTEVHAIGDMVTARAYRHVPTGRLAMLAQRLGTVCASPSTWYSLVRRHRWRRPRLRVHPKSPSLGVRAMRPDELWHIDTTVIRLLDGTRPTCTP